MSKKWKKRVRRIDHVAAKVGVVAANVIPGVGTAVSIAGAAAIAADEAAAAKRHAANKADRNKRTAAAAAQAFNQQYQVIPRGVGMAPNPGNPSGEMGNAGAPAPVSGSDGLKWAAAAGAVVLLAMVLRSRRRG